MFRAWPAIFDRVHIGVVIDVARTRTVAQLADCVLGIRVFGFLVRPGLIVTGVAAGAVGLERSVLPDNNLGIVAVTVGAGQITAMVQWFERRCPVTEVIGQKRIGVVAAIAFDCSNKVPRILADRGRAVVARGTGAEHLGVIYVKRRRPDRRRMTVFTSVRRKCVLRILSGRYRAVVTANAVSGYVGMIEIRG